MIRLLQVIDGLRIGGAENVLVGIVQLSDATRFSMQVASVGPADRAYVERFRELGVHAHVVDSRGLWDVRTVGSLAALIRRERIDLVLTHLAGGDVQGGLAARLTGRPSVAVLHNVARDRERYRPARRALADLATRRFADRIIAVSEAVKDSHVEALGIPAERFVVIPNVPVAALSLADGFDRARKRAELGFGDAPLVVVASRLDHPKDHATLLRAFPQVVVERPDVHLLIMGDGPLRDELEALAQSLGIESSVTFAGLRVDAVEVMAAGDVFCHPTLYEGLPVALAEAMALGRPVVASDAPGVVELVSDDVSGVLVPPQDATALAAALTALLDDPARRQRLGDEAQRSIRTRFDPDRWARQIEEVSVDVLRERRARPGLRARLGLGRRAS